MSSGRTKNRTKAAKAARATRKITSSAIKKRGKKKNKFGNVTEGKYPVNDFKTQPIYGDYGDYDCKQVTGEGGEGQRELSYDMQHILVEAFRDVDLQHSGKISNELALSVVIRILDQVNDQEGKKGQASHKNTLTVHCKACLYSFKSIGLSLIIGLLI